MSVPRHPHHTTFPSPPLPRNTWNRPESAPAPIHFHARPHSVLGGFAPAQTLAWLAVNGKKHPSFPPLATAEGLAVPGGGSQNDSGALLFSAFRHDGLLLDDGPHSGPLWQTPQRPLTQSAGCPSGAHENEPTCGTRWAWGAARRRTELREQGGSGWLSLPAHTGVRYPAQPWLPRRKPYGA